MPFHQATKDTNEYEQRVTKSAMIDYENLYFKNIFLIDSYKSLNTTFSFYMNLMDELLFTFTTQNNSVIT